MLKKIPVFNYSSCSVCKICMQACPVSCITMSLPGKQGKYKNLLPQTAGENCIGCGQCAAACPMKCIKMEEAES